MPLFATAALQTLCRLAAPEEHRTGEAVVDGLPVEVIRPDHAQVGDMRWRRRLTTWPGPTTTTERETPGGGGVVLWAGSLDAAGASARLATSPMRSAVAAVLIGPNVVNGSNRRQSKFRLAHGIERGGQAEGGQAQRHAIEQHLGLFDLIEFVVLRLRDPQLPPEAGRQKSSPRRREENHIRPATGVDQMFSRR